MAARAGRARRRRLSALAMPPLDAWPVLFLTLPVLVWLIDGAAGGRLGGIPGAAIAGWWFGFGYHLAGLYWVGHAFLVDAKTFGWLLPFAVTGLPAFMACYTALGLALARMLWTRGPARLIALAVALTVDRMAARLSVHRLSLEQLRLRAHRPAGACARRGADRHLGADIRRGRGVREPRGAARRSQPTRGGRGCRSRSALIAARGARRLRRVAAVAHADRVRRQCAAAHHAAQSASRTRSSTTRAKQRVMSQYLELSDRSTGPQSSGVRDVDASDLAGIGVSVPADARARRDGADRGAAAAGHGADHRRGARAGGCRRARRSSAPTTRST